MPQIPTEPPLPTSLTGHQVPPDRLAVIAPHVANLSRTALAVSERLPLGADYGDVFSVMEEDANRK